MLRRGGEVCAIQNASYDPVGIQPGDGTGTISPDVVRAVRWREFIELAITCKLNLVWSGSVDAGKTHSMRSFTHAIPADWRIVTVEDTPELIDLPCPNMVHLLYSKALT